MRLESWPAEEKPREKLLTKGPESLSDSELLAIFLRTGYHGKDVVTLSRELIANFGSLRGLFTASELEFCSNKGLGTAKFVQLRAVLEMSQRYLQEPIKRGESLGGVQQTSDFLIAKMHDLPYEVFAAFLLDNQHRVICFHDFFFGTIDSSSVHPRIIAQKCLSDNAAAIILVHNHPSGNLMASEADKAITLKIVSVMKLIDVRVLDHFIVAGNGYISFAEKGWI